MKRISFLFLPAFTLLVMTCDNPFTPEPTGKEDLFKLSHDYDGGTRIVQKRPIVLTWSEITVTDFAKYTIHRSTLKNGKEVWEERVEITNPLQVTYTDTLNDDETFRYRIRIEDTAGNARDAQTEEFVLHTTSLLVPAEYESMQEAYDTPFIDDGDTVFVEYVNPRTYARPFLFVGKDIYIKGVGGPEEVVVSHGGTIAVMNRGTLTGFTFQKGGVILSGTAAMSDCIITGVYTSDKSVERSAVVISDSAEIRNCRISNNGKYALYGRGGNGGGMIIRGHATVRDCIITENQAGRKGGAVYISGEPTIMNCIIDRNIAKEVGGGMAIDGNPTIINSIITNNVAGEGGGGIFLTFGSTATVVN
ncbi:MAG: right-handed parallel beta-helix repeat-containing protein, partial [Candidatus Neomarinimicrobiota bacterium]